MKLPAWTRLTFLLTAVVLSSANCRTQNTPSEMAESLRALHALKIPPGPYDWMARHPEPEQNFEDFLAENPVRPDLARDKIYVTLLGDFDPPRKRIIAHTAEFMAIYFGMPVSVTDPIALSEIPRYAQRVHPQTGDHQILTRYVLDQILVPGMPRDAFAMIAFTSSDLWPGEGWNFVFGEASPESRVSVWSIYRNGDPGLGETDFRLCLLRTLKTGTHELGHLFGVAHCQAFECNMNGSNYREESDRRPLWLCPVCLRKLQWSIGFDVISRYESLSRFCEKHGLIRESRFYKKSAEALRGSKR